MSSLTDRIASLPCFGGEEVRVASTTELVEELSLGEGRTNQNFIVTALKTSKKFFVRVGEDLPAHGVSRVRERAAQRAAAERSLAPAVLHANEDIMVTEFVSGRALTDADVQTAAAQGSSSPLLRAVTTAIRELHSTPSPPELVMGATDIWSGPHLPKWLQLATESGYSRLPLVADAPPLIAELSAAAGELDANAPPSFCHFDLLPDNFVVTGDLADSPAIAVIDFEYSAAGQPLMDLAILSMGCGLDGPQEANLLASYLQLPEVSPELAHRFLALKTLAALRETFWGVVAEVSKASALSEAEASSYTDKNYEKLLEYQKAFAASKQALDKACVVG